jgi:hypothetical protein
MSTPGRQAQPSTCPAWMPAICDCIPPSGTIWKSRSGDSPLAIARYRTVMSELEPGVVIASFSPFISWTRSASGLLKSSPRALATSARTTIGLKKYDSVAMARTSSNPLRCAIIPSSRTEAENCPPPPNSAVIALGPPPASTTSTFRPSSAK